MCSLGINYVKKTWMAIPNILSTLHDKCEILPPVYDYLTAKLMYLRARPIQG